MNLSEEPQEKIGDMGSPISTESFLQRVRIGDPEPWVTVREADESFRPKASASSVWLLMDRQIHASRQELYFHTVQRLDTMQAVQQVAQWSLPFDPATQWVTIHSLRIRRQGNVTEHAQRERIRILQREENLERLVLDGTVTIVVLLDDVRVGDVLEVSYSVRTEPRLFRERYSTFVSVPTAIPLRSFFASVRFPSGNAMQWKSSGDRFPPTVSEVDGETEWRWGAENVEPEHPEAQVPSWQLPARWFQVSNCQSWNEVAAEFLATWPAPAGESELSRHADEIAASTEDPAERVSKAILLVQDEIRYLSHNIELGGQIPSAPETVLQRRFGDCKDKSYLLAHLLRRLGISAHPVLVSTFLRREIAQFLPTAAMFDHCIVEYDLDGQRRWVDATLLLQGGGALRRQVPDFEMGLSLRPDVTGLDPVPVNSRREDRYVLREIFRPDTSGGASVLEVSIIATGQCADGFRRSFSGEGPDAVARSREDLYRQRYEGLTRIGSILWRDDREANEFALAEIFEIPKLLVPTQDPNLYAVQCPAHLVHSVLALPGTPSRKLPMEFTPPRIVEHWIEIDFPSLMQGEVAPASVRSDAFHFWRETKRHATHFTLRAMADVVTPGQFASHRTAVEKACADAGMVFWVPAGYPVSRRGRRASLPASLPAASSRAARAPFGSRAKGITPRQVRTEGSPQVEVSSRPVSSRLGAPQKAPAFVPANHPEPSEQLQREFAEESRSPRRRKRRAGEGAGQGWGWRIAIAIVALLAAACLAYYYIFLYR